MKTFIAIIASFVLGILIGYYYREASVEEEIREKLYEEERQENERRKQKNDRLLEIINGNTDNWEEKWEEYIMEEMMNEGHPV